MDPALFSVLSIFHILRGLSKGVKPSPILFANAGVMKLLVAPESTSALISAIAELVLIDTGIRSERKRVITTELQLTALTQADGFRRPENPPVVSTPVTPSPLLHHHLLLR